MFSVGNSKEDPKSDLQTENLGGTKTIFVYTATTHTPDPPYPWVCAVTSTLSFLVSTSLQESAPFARKYLDYPHRNTTNQPCLSNLLLPRDSPLK